MYAIQFFVLIIKNSRGEAVRNGDTNQNMDKFKIFNLTLFYSTKNFFWHCLQSKWQHWNMSKYVSWNLKITVLWTREYSKTGIFTDPKIIYPMFSGLLSFPERKYNKRLDALAHTLFISKSFKIATKKWWEKRRKGSSN